jgi:hypothetical protein
VPVSVARGVMLARYPTSVPLGAAWENQFLSEVEGELVWTSYDQKLKESLAYLLKSYHPQIDALTQLGNRLNARAGAGSLNSTAWMIVYSMEWGILHRIQIFTFDVSRQALSLVSPSPTARLQPF